MITRRRVMLLGCLGSLLMLAGCGGSDDEDLAEATATVGAAVATVAPPAIPLEIGEIVWASGVDSDTGAPSDTLTSLPNSAERVVAALQIPSLPSGTTIQARWTIDGDPLPNLDPAPIVVEEPLEDAWVNWSLSWRADEPWPIGTLGISVEIDGDVVASTQIPIVWDRS